MRKVQFYVRCNYSVPRSVNAAVVLPYTANTVLDRSGDLRPERTRIYPKKHSSMVTTRCDKENQVFLETYSLQSFTRSVYISAFFIRKRKQQYRS